MLFIKLNKEYKEEIIYETMIKMGFLYYYNDKQGNRNKYYYNSKGIQYDTDKTSVHKIYVGLFLSFDKNNILSIDMSNWLYFSEFLAILENPTTLSAKISGALRFFGTLGIFISN